MLSSAKFKPSISLIFVSSALLIVLLHQHAVSCNDQLCGHSLVAPPHSTRSIRFKRAALPSALAHPSSSSRREQAQNFNNQRHHQQQSLGLPRARSRRQDSFRAPSQEGQEFDAQHQNQNYKQNQNQIQNNNQYQEEHQQAGGGNFERPPPPPLPSKNSRISNDGGISIQPIEDQQQQQQADESRTSKVIETAVFIDQALVTRFNGLSNGLVELNKLVLTIMNQVQYLFDYTSMQVPLRLRLVLIEQLRESERQFGLQMPNAEKGDIDAYLSNFCNWQQMRLARETRLWWDHAILLSGLDLYKATPGRNHSGVLGLAWVGGMCKGNYSCTINEAANFESAFVIAHELGHSLGIMHDGQKNRCDPNSFIMSERTGAGKVNWSKCSNSYLNDSIKRGQLACLDSEQTQQLDSLYDLTKLRAPGQVYSINEQCKLAFGNNYTSFLTQQAPFNAVCRELWCVAGSWAKAAHPALDGSSCGDLERVCREGKCINK